MKLEIRFQADTGHNIAAAYLPGNPTVWFAEIAHWAIDPLALDIYPVPQSIADNTCAGIFVVFKGAIPVKNKLRYPFKMVADGFFIPADGQLFPQLLPGEMEKLKLWPIQFFHPHIGLAGFENEDAHSLSEWIEMPQVNAQNWLTDFKEVGAMPQLQGIMLEEAPVGAMASLMALIGVQPLSDIPNSDEADAKKSKFDALWKPLQRIGLWIILILAYIGKFILQFIAFFLPKLSTDLKNRATPSFLQKLESWIAKKMASIEKQRDTELNRLVKLFDQDKDAALQYAIPLNSTVLNRGVAPQSGKLSRQSLNFNFGRLGVGGGAVDVWDIGNYRQVLQQKYEKAAEQAIEKGDFKKAAYIYAHLLADYFRAAKILEEGKHYREAASVYQEQLNNKSRAAECLEKGGLLNEAITLYVEMENYEKAGDLYQQQGQHQKAVKYYEEVVGKCLNARDNLKAAKLINVKIGDGQRSMQVLLDGWKYNHDSEKCLKTYFDTATEMGNPLTPAVKHIFKEEVGKSKGTSFLNVLAAIVSTAGDENLKEEALTICYEIASRQSAYGDFSALKMISRFLPDDKLIIQDANRYAINNHKEVKQQKADYYIPLDPEIRWKAFGSFHDQLIGIGANGDSVLLLRMNWEGHEEYSYLFTGNATTKCKLVVDAGISNNMLVISDPITSGSRNLPASSFFERELLLHQFNWITPFMLHVAPNPDGLTVSAIVASSGRKILLNQYNFEGKEMSSMVCLFEGEELTTTTSLFRASELYLRKSHLYFITASALVRVDEAGHVDFLEAEHPILNFSVSGVHTALKIAVLTEAGCFIVNPNLKEMPIGIPLFAQGLNAGLVQLLSNNQLVLASAQKAEVYDISGKTARLLVTIVTDHDIVKILTVRKRNHFALLEADNRISVHVLKNVE